ncbi:hypothetical protein BDP27DRAFT_1425435 [Rhodocollybia butyracea]|uniref:Uncharacterized protein n=1 Tax=Rhodocollybia butyracea TaxID=206335 RepID=A0A9P5PK45_9AGAR|nr:hypothetical protein BDP27DRAFT_1425435 [Rhodocollybia butyracea]
MAEGPVNLNWDPIMKHINESPYEFFQGSWTFLCSTTQGVESKASDASDSEFVAEPDELAESASSAGAKKQLAATLERTRLVEISSKYIVSLETQRLLLNSGDATDLPTEW